MDHHNGHVFTLANSIIGVSILAMPYCFKQCGILLAILLLLLSNLLARLSCHFLMKSAIIARRKTFEYLAYYIFGGVGKFLVEVGMIGFLIGTCIAFFVVMGDLGPEIISEATGQDVSSTMRTSILMALALFCILPLALLRNVDSLVGVSRATLAFYFCLVLKIVIKALPHLFAGDWIDKVEFWRPAGVIQCLPIFSMALSCQTQLFEIYQVVTNPTLEKMNYVVKNAVNMCTLVYLFVGVFGYIAFAQKNLTGNILISFIPSVLTTAIKLCFILSVAFSFPLVIFPCRASIHSLIYRAGITLHEGVSNYIPEGRFKGITFIVVFVSLIVGILIPNIELVLGLVGSTIGIMICVLFPAFCFIYISSKNTNETLLAKLVLIIGIVVMILGTFENLHSLEKREPPLEPDKKLVVANIVAKSIANNYSPESVQFPELSQQKSENQTKMLKVAQSSEVRHEPPQPEEPQEPVKELAPVKTKSEEKIDSKIEAEIVLQEQKTMKNKNETKNDQVDPEAIKKDELEIRLQEKETIIKDLHMEEDHKILLNTIQKQNEVQEEIVKQQQKLIEVIEKQEQKANEEKLKAVKEIESIALKAIEQISSDTKKNEEIVAKVEKDVSQKVNTNENNSANKVGESNLENLKVANILLKARIKENKNNITTKRPITDETNGQNQINLKSILPQEVKSNNSGISNGAPLFQNLGQPSQQINKTINNSFIKEAFPLPMIVSESNELAKIATNFSAKQDTNILSNNDKKVSNSQEVANEKENSL